MADLMRAVVCERYGPPENLKQVQLPKPMAQSDEIVVRVRASAVTNSDIFIRSLKVPWQFRLMMRFAIGFWGPRRRITGIVFSGDVDHVGSEITQFKPGDQVFGMTGYNLGCYAEFAIAKEKDSIRFGTIAMRPGNVSHEHATVACYGGLLALQVADKAGVARGKKVCVYGASGTSGTLAVQYAKHLGAQVTGVCSAKNSDLVKSLGADAVMDYTATHSIPEDTTFDIVLDCVGRAKTSSLKKALKTHVSQQGVYTSIDDGDMALDANRLQKIAKLVESGDLKPVLDRSFELDNIVQAHHYVEGGHKVGGVAVTISS